MTPKDMMAAWNETAKRCGLPTVRLLTEGRRRHADARLRQIREELGEDPETTIRQALEKVCQSSFLRGEIKNASHPNWRLGFDEFITPRIFIRIIEGRYDDRSSAPLPSDPDYSVRSKIESFLKTGRWPYGTPSPRDPSNTLPRHILAQYREQFLAKGWELPAW